MESLRVVVDRLAELEAILVTRFLDYSSSVRALIASLRGVHMTDQLMDAMVELLTRLHLAGFTWGDCSLSNTLFRFDAGALAACLVDAETAEMHERLSPRAARVRPRAGARAGRRRAPGPAGRGPPGRGPRPAGGRRRSRAPVQRPVARAHRRGGHAARPEQRYRIAERIRRLNELGFEVDEVELIDDLSGGSRLTMHTRVAEPGRHRRELMALTGLDVWENQARRLLADIAGFRGWMEQVEQRRVPPAVAANRWLREVYQPVMAATSRRERPRQPVSPPGMRPARCAESRFVRSARIPAPIRPPPPLPPVRVLLPRREPSLPRREPPFPRGEPSRPYRFRRRSPEGGLPGRGDRGVPLAVQPEPSEPDRPVADGTADAPGTGRVPRRPRTRLVLLLAAVVLVADVVSKLVVVATIPEGNDIRVLGGVLYLTHLRNVGAAFSFAQGATILFTVIAVAVAGVILRTARRLYSAAWAIALGLVLGGALGNLMDRIFRAPGFLRGGVVDFLSLFAPDGRIWPVFNVADSAIVCGGILGALLALRGIEFDGSRGRDDDRSDTPAGDGPPRP